MKDDKRFNNVYIKSIGRASKRNFERRNKTGLGLRVQAETSLSKLRI
jgi:hypothetical protein